MRSAFCRLAFVALFAATACAATGCGNEQETINRVQPNAVEKTAFDGEWYYLQTVVDTPAGTPYTFVGDQSGVRKIEWQIEENFLIARRSYDLIAGAEQEGADAINDAANTTLAKFRISSHFDIRRDYNPATGEETNVISENTVDRPWSEREFMRVDWSENLVNDGDFMTLKKALDGLKVESSYFVQTGENAPLFEKAEDGSVNYIDITNKAFIQPTTVDIPGYGPIPTCFLNGHELDLCQDVEISVRNSFMKVVDRDYQPVVYTGDRMEKFGFFVDERKGYSRDYGAVESERYRFAQRHNLWMKSHRVNDKGERIQCLANKECDDKRGSVCDTAWGLANREYAKNGAPIGLCTVPYRDREIRPIVYYMSKNHPDELTKDADTIALEWNKAFVATVASLRENECLTFGGKDCAAERSRGDHQKIFHVCTTPVAKGDPEACGAEGLAPRPGDLRYSQVVWVSSEESGGPLGYGPGHSDPETGETLMGNAFLYGTGMEKLAVYGRDLVKVLNGDLTPAEIQSGDYISALTQIARSTEGDAGNKHAIEMTPELLAADIKHMDRSWATSDAVKSVPRSAGALKEAIEAASKAAYRNGAFGSGVNQSSGRLERLVGTDIEAMMVTPEMRMAAGLDPHIADIDENVLNSASPLRGMGLDAVRAVERARQIIREKFGYYDADFQDEGLVGLAIEIKNAAAKANGIVKWYGRDYVISKTKGKIDYEQVRKMIFHPMYHGLTLHEIGHSIGLRHNFSGSFDAVNYAPQYWDLRDDGKMEPRFWDEITEKEKEGRIREYQYSTVMDYGHNFIVSDAHGIGHYDMAAIKMGYGDLVEVFAEVPDAGKVASVSFIQGAGYPIMLDVFSGTNPKAYVYTQWPELVGGRANLEKRIDVPYTSLQPEPMLSAGGIPDKLVDAKGRPSVPYLFCSDEQADLNPDCMRYDAGADAYESVQSIVDSYWYYYPFINFRRQRLGFDVQKTVARIHGRYFEKVKRAHQTYALYVPIFKDIFNLTDDSPFWEAKDGMGAWSAAADVGFKMLQQVITAPEPGNYSEGPRPDGSALLTPAGGGGLVVSSGTVDEMDGRFLETTWDFDAGYYWFDQLDRVGYFYDKVYALMTLVDPTTYFINRDTDADIRQYQINYSRTFGSGVNSMFRALLSEDWTAVAPRLENNTVVYPDLTQIEKRSMSGTPLAPNVSFSIQLYAAVFGMAYIPQTYDQDFINSSRLWIEGGAEEIALDPTLPVVTFSDPESGLSYSAVSYLDETGLEQGVGASLLAYANTLAATAAGADDVVGTEDDDKVATDAMHKFVDNIDIVRRLTWQLGFGAQP